MVAERNHLIINKLSYWKYRQRGICPDEGCEERGKKKGSAFRVVDRTSKNLRNSMESYNMFVFSDGSSVL